MTAVIKKSNLKIDEVSKNSNWQLFLLVVLLVSVVFVAIKIVVHRHESRSLYMGLRELEKERDILAAQWSRLKLEQGTVLNQVRVEQQARNSLQMKMPKTSDIRIVREAIKADTLPSKGKVIAAKVAFSD